MNHSDFENGAREIVESYWRIRAAIRMIAPAPGIDSKKINFEGVPQLGALTGLLQTETVRNVKASLELYATSRLSRDMFIALIALFERRLSFCLVRASRPSTGTLGALQITTQSLATIPAPLTEDFDEVRERRNAQMHHDGCAHQKYLSAAQKVYGRAYPHVSQVQQGASVIPDGKYLTYAADVMVRYSAVL